MAKTKTIHAGANGKAHQIEFPTAEIAEITKFDPSAGRIKWRVSLAKGMEALFEHMGWALPGETTTVESFATKLKGGNFIFTSKEKLVDREIDIAFVEIKGFTCHRFEITGRKKKGFRRELRFDMTFQAPGTAAEVESYMEQVGAEGTLKVRHLPEESQTEMDLSSDEQRQAVLETKRSEPSDAPIQ